MSSENVARRVTLDHGGLPVNPALRPRFFSRLFRSPCTFTPAGFFISPAQPVTFLNSLNGEGHVLVSSGGWALTASGIAGHQSSAGYRAAFPPIPTRSNASLLSLSFLRTIPARARSTPFVPLRPEVPDLLEIQDRWFAFSDDCRALTLLGRQYHRSHHCRAQFHRPVICQGHKFFRVHGHWSTPTLEAALQINQLGKSWFLFGLLNFELARSEPAGHLRWHREPDQRNSAHGIVVH